MTSNLCLLEPIQELVELDESFVIPVRWLIRGGATWKPEHRLADECRGLRYPSDMNDSEWMLIAPRILPPRRGGRPRDVNLREILNAIFLCACDRLPMASLAEAPGLPKARCITTSCCGIGTARWSTSMKRSMSRFARRLDAKRAQLPRSSDSRDRQGGSKGLCARPAGLWRWQEGHGPQAPHPRRHARSASRRERSAGQHSGP